MPPDMNQNQEDTKEVTMSSVPSNVDTKAQFNESPNARSKSITTAAGPDTHGTLNQHLSGNLAYQVGVHDDRGQRRTMEDAYSFVVDFARVRGQGYFAVFDGHAGKHAAEWCGQYFHENLLTMLAEHKDLPIPDVLNYTFHTVDSQLSAFAAVNDKMHSGCTAVTAFLRIEDADGKQGFLEGVDIGSTTTQNHPMTGSPKQEVKQEIEPEIKQEIKQEPDPYPTPEPSNASKSNSPSPRSDSPTNGNGKKEKKKSGILNKGSQVISTIKSLTSSSSGIDEKPIIDEKPDISSARSNSFLGRGADAISPPADAVLKRVLYTANAGDARAVLCRGGRGVRLTYDHKGSDKQEAKRIMDAGGFVMSGRVNGVLAVTRSLGDSSMKDFVVGSPYTTETELGDDDEFLILACDGLWDVCSDQEAVDMIRNIFDPQVASRTLVEHALKESTDNITAIVVRFPSPTAPAT